MDTPFVSSGAAVTARSCPACGEQFAPGTSPAGLCPACLLKSAFPTDEDPDQLVDEVGTTLPEGAIVGPFVIAGLLGRGGMSAVYRAEDVHLTRTVALKVLPQEFLHDRTFARRFEHEARIIAGLEHPHIVPIYASGIDNSIPWMSMRLMSGGHLGALLEQRQLEPAEAIRILRHVADALDYAHARGVVHRDIKPTNLLLDGVDGVYISDFGLAQMLEHDPRATRTGTIVGTPHYIAPERALGERADHRCDIYSLGIVAYEMFVGRLPFAADSPIGVLLKHVNEPLPAPPAGLLPQALADALQKAAAKDPAKRWPSAGAFVFALEGALAASPSDIEGLRAERRQVLVTPARLRRTGTLIGGLAVAIGLTWWLVRDPSPRPTPSASTQQQQTNLAPAGSPEPVARDTRPAASRGTRPPAHASTSSRAQDEKAQASPPPMADTPSESSVPFAKAPPPTAAPIEPSGVTTVEAPTEHTPAAAPSNATAPAAAPPPGAHTQAPVPQPSGQSDKVTPPKLVRKILPVYPPQALAADLEGTVILEVEVGVDGRVRNVRVKQSRHNVLAEAARKAVQQYQYEPARRNGVPEARTITVPVPFKLP